MSAIDDVKALKRWLDLYSENLAEEIECGLEWVDAQQNEGMAPGDRSDNTTYPMTPAQLVEAMRDHFAGPHDDEFCPICHLDPPDGVKSQFVPTDEDG